MREQLPHVNMFGDSDFSVGSRIFFTRAQWMWFHITGELNQHVRCIRVHSGNRLLFTQAPWIRFHIMGELFQHARDLRVHCGQPCTLQSSTAESVRLGIPKCQGASDQCSDRRGDFVVIACPGVAFVFFLQTCRSSIALFAGPSLHSFVSHQQPDGVALVG